MKNKNLAAEFFPTQEDNIDISIEELKEALGLDELKQRVEYLAQYVGNLIRMHTRFDLNHN